MKERPKKVIEMWLREALLATEREDYRNAFLCLRPVIAMFELDGFEMELLIPEKRTSVSALMESFCGEKQISVLSGEQ